MTITLAVGLIVSVRAARANADLAGMRADFVSAVTHELKTPLANIRAINETLASGRTTPEMIREYARMGIGETTRLTRLVDNLLAYSRVTDVADVYSFEPVPVADVVQRSLFEFGPNLQRDHFQVQVSLPDELPLVKADPNALGLLFNNLIDNAIRYSREASRFPSARARMRDRSRSTWPTGASASLSDELHAGDAKVLQRARNSCRRQRPRPGDRRPHRDRPRWLDGDCEFGGTGHDGFGYHPCGPVMKKRVLVVEDDPVLTRVLRDNLTFEGFRRRVGRRRSAGSGARSGLRARPRPPRHQPARQIRVRPLRGVAAAFAGADHPAHGDGTEGRQDSRPAARRRRLRD